MNRETTRRREAMVLPSEKTPDLDYMYSRLHRILLSTYISYLPCRRVRDKRISALII
jgi:hypothetical protein